jgi:hypothetical protein
MTRVRKLAILLPPSEGKAPGGRDEPWRPGTMALPELDDRRAAVLAALGPDGPHAGPTMAAGERYTGVLYRELGLAGLPVGLRRRFARQALVVSGLWGLVAPGDPIPHYKLKMSAAVPGLGKLSTWWRPALTEVLAERLAGHTVWDLLPIEHSAAWTPAAVPMARRYTVRFVTATGATVSHWNKVGKGALVRALLERQSFDPADLSEITPAGYRLDLGSCEVDRSGGLVVFRAS